MNASSTSGLLLWIAQYSTRAVLSKINKEPGMWSESYPLCRSQLNFLVPHRSGH